ncbi:MAG: hypothetical protein O2921_01495 [Chloroflexi bacterium]|nr:hypothetical protein [Chloroflexota bacterium]MDA1281290.1 hypothetical protein [Chloroflexota bacterium]
MTDDSAPTTKDTRSPLRRLFSSRTYASFFVGNTLAFGGEQMRLAARNGGYSTKAAPKLKWASQRAFTWLEA